MAHGFHGRQERFHFRLRHRPTSIFPRHDNPRISQRGARLKATNRSKTQTTVSCQETSGILRKLTRGRPTHALIPRSAFRSEEHTSELQSRVDLVCRLLLE